MDLPYIFSIILLALGFGFVIFWHELGHFLAAKWAGVKVEQFAVGFGTAALAWRKGIGVRVGTTRHEYEKRAREYLLQHEGGKLANVELADATTDERRIDLAAKALGLGETEYRLNWLPLGGYVKMLGQDDLDPNKVVDDPRAYNRQTIAKRMVIVSAGVIMNIILAAIGFFVLFMIGFNAPPAIVGSVMPMSPAQRAGLQVGDQILKYDGGVQHDFTKIVLNVALSDEAETVPVEVKRADGRIETLQVRPERQPGDTRGILLLGIMPSVELRGIDSKKIEEPFDPKIHPASLNQVRPDETVVRVGEQEVTDPASQYFLLDRAINAAEGKPVEITVKQTDGQTRVERIQSGFVMPFDEGPSDAMDFAGMVPRTRVSQLEPDSKLVGMLMPGDIIASVLVVGPNDRSENPSRSRLQDILHAAGDDGKKVQLSVLRGGESVTLAAVEPSYKVKRGNARRKGIGVGLDLDAQNAVVAMVEAESPAASAGIPQGAQILSIDGNPATSWYDVHRIFKHAKPDQPMTILAKLPEQAEPREYKLTLPAASIARLANYRYVSQLALHERIIPRHTTNPITAAKWGVGETRDLIAQFYLTLKRMVQGSVPASNLMGPVGIAQAGARLADRGIDWLLWFLSQISANLAVVNFLPIPIVDGGLFLFLIIEKLQGRPLSARTQSIAQVIGLALIVSVFIFVTYQDIVR